MGRYNISNATILCTLFKYLLFVEDLESARHYLETSL
jgi:hypothetical protein